MEDSNPLREQSDEALMAAYVAGDVAAFDLLFERYAALVLGIARRYTATSGDAEDVVQQTFLNLHRARRDFRQGSRLRPWLATIALNVAREHGRRRARRPAVALAVDVKAPGAGPADEAVARDDRERVRMALNGLGAAQRQVIELHWFAGLSFPEVAQAVGAGLSAVKVRAHRGYAKLREALTGEVTGTPGRP